MTDFENAISEVQSSTGQVIETEMVVTPLLDQGMYPATCVGVLVTDAPYPDAKPGTKVFQLKWQLEEEKYSDKDGNQQPYILLSRPCNIFFGKKAALTELSLKLTGRPPVREEHREKLDDGRTILRSKFAPDQFVGMKSSLIVEHKEHKGRTYANVGNYLTGVTEREYNCSHLPNLPINKHGE